VHLHEALILFSAALVAGVLNSVAGGGSFVSFPTLLLTGVPPIPANATNTAALWPGTVASSWAYRGEIARHRRLVPLLTIIGIAGGVVGARILLRTPPATFMRLIPWLLFLSTLLFVFGARIARWVRHRTLHHPQASTLTRALTLLLLFLMSIYVGYFGAGVGIVLSAVFSLMGLENIHAINGLRTYLVSVCNLVAIATFIAAGAVLWPQGVVMLVGAAAGGYSGAHYAQKMDPRHVRHIVIAVGFAMSGYFFFRIYIR